MNSVKDVVLKVLAPKPYEPYSRSRQFKTVTLTRSCLSASVALFSRLNVRNQISPVKFNPARNADRPRSAISERSCSGRGKRSVPCPSSDQLLDGRLQSSEQQSSVRQKNSGTIVASIVINSNTFDYARHDIDCKHHKVHNFPGQELDRSKRRRNRISATGIKNISSVARGDAQPRQSLFLPRPSLWTARNNWRRSLKRKYKLKNFKSLGLIAPLQRALTEQNYVTPTPIQAKTLPSAIEGIDILGCAQTGTGKTAAFALPILDWLGQELTKPRPRHPQALVLAPTRELAVQIGDSFRKYGKFLPLKISMVYGGVSQRNQVRELASGVHVLVATPGRLLDLMSQGHVHMDELDIFVLDEADRMLDMGFLPDLKRTIKALPEERQSLFFSATLPPEIRSLAKQLLWKPISVDVTPKISSVETIEQRVMLVQRTEKQSILNHILAEPNVDRAIVFTRTKRGANRLTEKLDRKGIKAAAIHGNKSQSARQKALDAFRNARIRVLVATDVAARGIDKDGVTHVVNFDMPTEPESYVHRIGRTGRAGADGIAISLCTPEENGDLKAIERLIGKKVPIAKNPSLPMAVSSRLKQPGKNTTKSNHRARPTRTKRTRPQRRQLAHA